MPEIVSFAGYLKVRGAWCFEYESWRRQATRADAKRIGRDRVMLTNFLIG